MSKPRINFFFFNPRLKLTAQFDAAEFHLLYTADVLSTVCYIKECHGSQLFKHPQLKDFHVFQRLKYAKIFQRRKTACYELLPQRSLQFSSAQC
jgi:hypothetical protein